jgi:O-antigen ligase
MRLEGGNLIHRIIFIGLCCLLVYIPLPYGGVEEWAIFIFEAAVILLFALHLAGRFAKSADPEAEEMGGPATAEKIPWLIKALLAVFFIIAGIQLVPLPPALLKAISPHTAGLYESLVRDGIFAMRDSAGRTLSLSPVLSIYELLKYLCYGIFAYLVYAHIRSRKETRVFVLVMLATGVFESLYGLEEYFGGTYRIFAWKNIYYSGNAFGTFVNRNHFSGFLEMLLALSIGYLLARADFFSMMRGLSLREKIVWFGQERLQKTIIAGIIPVILGIGIIFSRSRSGIFIFLASLLIMIVFISLSGGGREAGEISRSRRPRRIISAVFALVAGIAIWIGLAPVLERFSPDLIGGEGRPIIYKYTLDVVQKYPVFGVGSGSYLYGYNMAEREYTPTLKTHAHNDYLEVLAESGVAGGGALIAAGLAALALMGARWTKRRDYFVKGVMLGCIAGISGMLIHSITDFGLRMPANAAFFVALYALGLRAGTLRSSAAAGAPGFVWGSASAVLARGFKSRASAEPVQEESPEPVSGFQGRKATTVLMAAGTILLMILVIKHNMGFLYLNQFKTARAKLADNGRSLMSGYAELDALLKKAVSWSGSPQFYEEQGRFYLEMAMAENTSGNPQKREAYLDLSREAQAERIRRNPADAFAYYDMSRVYMFSNFPLLLYQDKARFYMRKALDFKPHDQFLNVNVVYNFLLQWAGLSEEERAFVFKTLKTVWPVDAEKFYPALVERWKRDVKDLNALRDILRLDPDVWKTTSRFL